MQKVCVVCQKTYTAVAAHQLYCSQVCSQKAYRRKIIRTPFTPEKKSCRRCEKEFTTTVCAPHQIYCTRNCSSLYRKRAKRTLSGEHKCCKCGRRSWAVGQCTYCRIEERAQETIIARRILKIVEARTRFTLVDNCVGCGEMYRVRTKTQRFCCDACRDINGGYAKHRPSSKRYSWAWHKTRTAFILASTVVRGQELSNSWCIECFKKSGSFVPVHAVDHIVRVRDGGSDDFNNLQSLCLYHHQSKSAIEGNIERYGTQRYTQAVDAKKACKPAQGQILQYASMAAKAAGVFDGTAAHPTAPD